MDFKTQDYIVGGFDIIWFSDRVITGGGALKCEAAALGVPVYCVFCVPIVRDHGQLAGTGRSKLIASADDVCIESMIDRWARTPWSFSDRIAALECNVESSISIMETKALSGDSMEPVHHTSAIQLGVDGFGRLLSMNFPEWLYNWMHVKFTA